MGDVRMADPKVYPDDGISSLVAKDGQTGSAEATYNGGAVRLEVRENVPGQVAAYTITALEVDPNGVLEPTTFARHGLIGVGVTKTDKDFGIVIIHERGK